jgi:hypothetical protein
MYWVVILMSLSAGRWHRGGMTVIRRAGFRPGGARSEPRHVPIVIDASPELRRPVWVGSVGYPAVMSPLLVTARVVRLGAASARIPADVGRAGMTAPISITALLPSACPVQENSA